jgi:hypothetical protein
LFLSRVPHPIRGVAALGFLAIAAFAAFAAAQQVSRTPVPKLERRLRIVTMDGTPVPGARLMAPHFPAEIHDGEHALDAIFADAPELVRSDEHGEMVLTDELLCSCCVVESEAGRAHVHPERPSTEIQTVVVKPQRDVIAMATDQKGAPLAGVPLELMRPPGNPHWIDEWIVRTGEDGMARWPAAELFLDPDEGSHSRLHVAPAFPTRSWPAFVLASEALRAEPFVFQTGRSGSVELRVVDAAGADEPVNESIDIWLTGDETLERDEPAFDPRCSMPRSCEFQRGRCTLDRIGLGMRILCFAHDENLGRYECATAGPTREGESVQVVLRHSPRPPGDNAYVKLRAVDEHGAPIRGDGRVWWFSDVRGTSRWRYGLSWNAAGREHDEFFVDDDGPAPPQLVLAIESEEHGLARVARVQLTTEQANLGGDLGDIVLGEAPVLVDGIAADVAGHSPREAKVWLEESGNPSFRREPCVAAAIDHAMGTTDESGRFSIHGIADCRRAILWVDAPGFARPIRQPITVGERDVRVVLTEGGTITGCAEQRGKPVGGLGILALHASSPSFAYWWARRTTTTSADGRFELRDVPTGEVELFIDPHPYDGGCVVYDSLVDLPKVPVHAGETTDLGTIEIPRQAR